MATAKKTGGLGGRAEIKRKSNYLDGILGNADNAPAAPQALEDDNDKKLKTKGFKLDEDLIRRFSHYCIDHNTKEVRVIRELLDDFLTKAGY